MKQSNLLFFLLLTFCITSCTSSKKVPYLQTKDRDNRAEIDMISLYEENIIRFKVDDILSITINIPGEQSIAYDFNLPVQPSATTDNSSTGEMSTGYGRQTYQVNRNGEINFPFLGLIKVSGYTKYELETYLKKELQKYIKVEPIVTVYLTNFYITVLGEVGRPGQYTVSKNHVNILEMISLAGDLTLYGQRDNVKIMRQMQDGEIKIITIDISQADIITSPYFYLAQNDLIYVEPNKMRVTSAYIGTSTNLILSLIGTGMSLISFIFLVTRK